MSTPAPTLPDTPQEALGIPDNPLGRFPTLAGRNASRRRSRGPGGGLPKNPLGGSTPRTPGTLSPSERRAQAKQRLTVVRPEAKSEPAKAAKAPPPDDRPRTPAGAPVERPREVPKTGKAEKLRDAIRHPMSQDTRHMHEGMSAEEQDQFNKLSRADQDRRRRELADARIQHMKDLREQSKKDERARRQRGPKWKGIDDTLDSLRGKPKDE